MLVKNLMHLLSGLKPNDDVVLSFLVDMKGDQTASITLGIEDSFYSVYSDDEGQAHLVMENDCASILVDYYPQFDLQRIRARRNPNPSMKEINAYHKKPKPKGKKK